MASNNKNNQEGIIYIGNSFVPKMAERIGNGGFELHSVPITEKEFKEACQKPHYSIMGHKDSADEFGIEFNREAVTLSENDVVYYCELHQADKPSRLEEGLKELPSNHYWEFLRGVVKYPKIKMGRDTYLKDEIKEVKVIYDIHDDSAWFIIKKENGERSLEKAYYGDIQRYIKIWRGVPIIEWVDDGASCTPLTKEVKFEWNGWEHTLKKASNGECPYGIFRGKDLLFCIEGFSVENAQRALQSFWDWNMEPFEGDVFY